ncbi:MAG: GNAT family N-acetyltransferase [Deltaproteobacteria bacterium]|nr:GNAT family N-acetyltransferase [Deltaproteobacteria bacterium]
MNKIRIRRLRLEDADSISKIQESITKVPVSPDFKQIILEHAPKAEEASFVAEIEGKVVGYMISYILSGSFGMDKNAWIAQFGVDPQYMGQGIGKSLAEEIFKFYKSRGITDIFTSVRWDSTDLLSFFKTLGFDRSNFINLRKVLD